MNTFNDFFNTDFTAYNNKGIKSFISMLEANGFTETRKDWFQCGTTSAIKYIYRNDSKFIAFTCDNKNRIDVSNYVLSESL